MDLDDKRERKTRTKYTSLFLCLFLYHSSLHLFSLTIKTKETKPQIRKKGEKKAITTNQNSKK
jgi:hypothetical protein